MLETIREFALEQLEEADEAETARDAHAAYFLALAERTVPMLRGPEQGQHLDRLDIELDNLRAASDWVALTGQLEQGVRLAGSLGQFWSIRGRVMEGRRRLERALAPGLAEAVPSPARAQALLWLGRLTAYQTDYDLAESQLEDALAMWRGLDDRTGIARALTYLGGVTEFRGDDQRAWVQYNEALRLFTEQGNKWSIAQTLENLGDTAFRRGDLDRSAALMEEAVRVGREAGDTLTLAVALTGAAEVAIERGTIQPAVEWLREALRLAQSISCQEVIIDTLVGFARVSAVSGQAAAAARLIGAGEAGRDAMGAARMLHHEQHRRTVDAVRDALGVEAYMAAWTAGQELSTEQAIDEALAVDPPTIPSPSLSPPAVVVPPVAHPSNTGLSAREWEVLCLMAAGNSNQRIATALGVGVGTVKTHVSNVLGKLGVDSRAAAVAMAHQRGFLRTAAGTT